MNMRSAWMAWRGWRRLVLALGAAWIGVPAWAQNTIESVTGSMQGGVEIVKIDLNRELAALPTGFAIQSPARIALDFPATANALGRSAVEINQGNLKSVNVVQAGDRTRVVLNLKQAAGYQTRVQGKSVLVFLEAAAAVSPGKAAPAPAAAAAAAADSATQALKDVDFRRGAEGSGRVIVTLPHAQLGVGVQRQGQTLQVEFTGSTLPEGLRRRLDVSDFGTPVQAVTTFQSGDRVRMVIESKGQWQHSAYQTDDQFVVEVMPLKPDPSKLSPGPGYTGQKLTLNFQNIEIRSLLQVIADFTNFNVVTSDSVTGSVTLRLQDVPWDQALDIILQAKGLGVRKAGNVLWVAPKDEIIAKEKLEREAQVALEGLEAVQTQAFQLNFAKAVDVARQLMGAAIPGLAVPMAAPGGAAAASGRILSLRGSAIPEPRTNQLFVTDIPGKIEQVRQLILKLDIPVRQVLIEARIVEADDSFGKALGARLGGGSASTINAATTSGGVQFGGTYSATSVGAAPGGFVNMPATAGTFPSGVSALGAPAAFAVSIFGEGAARFLNLEISALEADNKGKVVSSPRVVTADKIKALIEQGTELPYQVATASGATSIAFRKANLKLEVTPQITPEGNIILELDINKDTVGQSTAAGFAIDTKHIQTQVLVENGGTVVIGGIFTMDEANQETKVPFFGDLPGLGNLFKSRSKKSIKKEMLVFITPKTLADRTVAR